MNRGVAASHFVSVVAALGGLAAAAALGSRGLDVAAVAVAEE
jgi:hypothetical protein